MIKIEITNFQSISHLELEFEGFATIIGRNFIGKSATLRAINAALTNRSGTDFIRWGEKFCEVHIITREYDILWHKESSNNYYEIKVGDGKKEKYEKIGKDEPPAPIKDAGFSVIKLGTDKVNLNYAEQFNPLFLVDRQDTKGADLLTSVYGLDVLYKAVELCGKEQKSNKDDLRIRKKDLEFIEKDLANFEGFEEVLERGKALKGAKKVLENAQVKIDKLSKIESDLKKVYVECNSLKAVEDIVLPDSGDISDKINKIVELRSYLIKINKMEEEVSKLKGIEDIVLPEAKSLSDDLSSVPTLRSYLDKIIKLQKELKYFEGLDSIEIPSCEIDVDEIENLNTKKLDIKRFSSEIKDIEEELAKVDLSIERVNKDLDSFDVCPLCGVEKK